MMLFMPSAPDLGVPKQIVLRLIAKLSVKILSTPGHGAPVNERLDVMGLKVTKIHFLISVDITVRDEARLIGQHIIPPSPPTRHRRSTPQTLRSWKGERSRKSWLPFSGNA